MKKERADVGPSVMGAPLAQGHWTTPEVLSDSQPLTSVQPADPNTNPKPWAELAT